VLGLSWETEFLCRRPIEELLDDGAGWGGRPAVNKRIIWTRYYSPREFYGYFRSDFSLQHYRGLCVFAPPPYIVSMHKRHPVWHGLLRHIDHRLAGWPLLRSIGDHFLIVMRKR
jgi:hypothetical protein